MIKDKKARSKNRLAASLSFGGKNFFYRLLVLNKSVNNGILGKIVKLT